MVIIAPIFFWLLPGFALSLLLFPRWEQVGFIGGSAIAFGLGFAASIAIGIGLTTFHQFNAASLWIAFILLDSILGVLIWRKRQIIRPTFSYDVQVIIALCITLMATLIPFTIWSATTEYHGRASGVGYYAQALEIVRSETVPLEVYDYGQPMYTITNKIGHNMTTAIWIEMGNVTNHFRLMLVFQTAMILAAITSLSAFLANFQLHPLIISFAIIVIAWLRHFSFKMSAYRAEAMGIALFFLALYAFHNAFRYPKNRQWSVIAGVTLGITALVHGVPGLVAVMWYTALTGAMFISEKWDTFRQRIPNMALTTVITGVLVFGVFILVGQGRIANQESVLGSQSFELDAVAGDPTHVFRAIISGLSVEEVAAQDLSYSDRFFIHPEVIRDDLLNEMTSFFFETRLNQTIGLIFIVISLASLWKTRTQNEMFPLAIIFFISILLAMGLFFSYQYDTRVLAEHPLRREFPYVEMMVIVLFALAINQLFTLRLSLPINSMLMMSLIVVGVWVIYDNHARYDRWSATYWITTSIILSLIILIIPRLRKRLLPWLPFGLAILTAILYHYRQREFISIDVIYIALAAGILSAIAVQDKNNRIAGIIAQVAIFVFIIISAGFNRMEVRYRSIVLSSDGYEAMQFIVNDTQDQPRIASNARTVGTFNVFLGQTALTEGRAPYLQPDNLNTALEVLQDWQHFFQCPTQNILLKYDVDYLIYTLRGESVGGTLFVDGDAILSRLDAFQGLEPVFSNETVTVFKINSAQFNPTPNEICSGNYSRVRTSPVPSET